MRDILFRGKRTDNGEWVEGFLYASDDIHRFGTCSIYSNCWIIKQTDLIVNEYGAENELSVWNEFIQVIPETVGQYTGLTDKNGKRIFEGDIVSCIQEECYGIIIWNNDEAGFYFAVQYEGGTTEEMRLYDYVDCIEVIGNIHDNPELIKQEALKNEP